MLEQTFHTAELIARYLTNTLQENEKQVLEEWINKSTENKVLFHRLCDSEQQKLHRQKSEKYNSQQGWAEFNQKKARSQCKNHLVRLLQYTALLVPPLLILCCIIKCPAKSSPASVITREPTIILSEK